MILAIDTSTEWIGLALHDGAQVLAEQTWRSKNYHTVELMPAIQKMLETAGVAPSELKAVAVATGPGSFTGLRIGLAAGKGIALALGIPLIGIPSLDVFALGQPGLRRPLIALLQIGRGRYAHARYLWKKESWQRQGEVAVDEPRAIAATITSPVYVVGELNAENRQILGRKWKTSKLATPANAIRRPSILAELAAEALKAKKPDETAALTPIYVHTLSNVPEV